MLNPEDGKNLFNLNARHNKKIQEISIKYRPDVEKYSGQHHNYIIERLDERQRQR